MLNEKHKIPEVLFYLMQYFEDNAAFLKLEGIFRRNCSTIRLTKLDFLLRFKNYHCLVAAENDYQRKMS
jgi:hypothetical protein